MKLLWGGQMVSPYVPHQNEMCCMSVNWQFEATIPGEAPEISTYWWGCRNPTLNKVGWGVRFVASESR